MHGDRSSGLNVVLALADVVVRASFQGPGVSVGGTEVEKLYLLSKDAADEQITSYTERFITAGFEQGEDVEQEDRFYDLLVEHQFVLRSWDYYVRVRRKTTSQAVSGEVKVSYPGMQEERSVRPATELRLPGEDDIRYWQQLLSQRLGFSVERSYLKWRRPSTRRTQWSVELEMDRFHRQEENGVLSGCLFVSTSIEIPDQSGQTAALTVLDEVARELGLPDELPGNYEDYFYRKLELDC